MWTAAVGAAVWVGHFAWRAFHYEETNDAYVSGHVHQVSPQISGLVQQVLVNDNQEVKAGDTLVRLDPLEYQIALQRAQAAVAEAKARLASSAADISKAQSDVAAAAAHYAQAQAQVRQAQAQFDVAQRNYARDLDVSQNNKGAVSRADIDAARGMQDARQADLDAANANLTAAKTGEESAQSAAQAALAQQKAAEAAVAMGEAEMREAQRKLDRATITAPTDGRVGNKNVETGNRVDAGETLLALVEPEFWVVANFKETQLARMRPGQIVEITIDALPGRVFRGIVDGFAPASGAQFALLPPDNATGNFTKVVQRVPVKILFDNSVDREALERLRLGLSAVVAVKTR
jgi:membrane fusion protein (multidrug efflux system)